MTISKRGGCSGCSMKRYESSAWPRRSIGWLGKWCPRRVHATAPESLPKGPIGSVRDLRIVADPPLIVPIEDLLVPGSEWEDPVPLIKKLLASYRRTLGHHGHPVEEFRYVHAALQGGGSGKRGYPLLHPAAGRPGPQRPPVPSGQGSPTIRPGAIPRSERHPTTASGSSSANNSCKLPPTSSWDGSGSGASTA